MDVVPINIDEAKAEYYSSVMDKYSSYSFTSKDDEKEFKEVLLKLLSENEKEVEFEYKIQLTLQLVCGVKLKRFGICYPKSSGVNDSK